MQRTRGIVAVVTLGALLGFSRGASAQPAGADGAIYKGLAIAATPPGPRLYATNFHAGTVDVYDGDWNLIHGGFVDANLPAGYAPFGIQTINETIYVTYALQDEAGEDEVAGPGNGFVDAYDLEGNFIRRVASGGVLNAPWGIALAPDGFGAFSNHLLIGNFGDGKIYAFRPDRLKATASTSRTAPCIPPTAHRSSSMGCGRCSSATARPRDPRRRCSSRRARKTRPADCSDRLSSLILVHVDCCRAGRGPLRPALSPRYRVRRKRRFCKRTSSGIG